MLKFDFNHRYNGVSFYGRLLIEMSNLANIKLEVLHSPFLNDHVTDIKMLIFVEVTLKILFKFDSNPRYKGVSFLGSFIDRI